MAQCLVKRVGASFKALIAVQANPNATVSAIVSDKIFTAVADSVTGIAEIIVKKKGTYTLTTDSAGKYDANGNTSAVMVLKKGTYNAQLVKLSHGYTAFKVTNEYASRTLLPYWEGTLGDDCSGNILEELSGENAVEIYSGSGTEYEVNVSLKAIGYLISNIAVGTEKTYRLGAYITINGKKYYGGYMTASGTAADYSVNAKKQHFTSSGKYTVPVGIRKLDVYCIAGGGGGGNSGYSGTGNGRGYGIAGGGGGGGRVSRGTLTVIPGQNISYTVGAGGNAASNGGSTTFSSVSASGGNAGGNGYASGINYYIGSGGSGGSGGGGGGMHATASSSSYQSFAQGGKGGSNGGSGSAGNKVPIYKGSQSGGNGGSGQGSSIVLVDGTYYSGGGGGGAGGSRNYAGSSGIIGSLAVAAGGNYGGGAGGWSKGSMSGSAGTANSGGGGGGGSSSQYQGGGTSYGGGKGGSGRILVISREA